MDMAELAMLSTIDNPWNPYTNWDEWFAYDTAAGYHSCSFLARVCNFSDEVSEADQDRAIQLAIDEIVRENVLGIYIKVTKDTDVNARKRIPLQPEDLA